MNKYYLFSLLFLTFLLVGCSTHNPGKQIEDTSTAPNISGDLTNTTPTAPILNNTPETQSKSNIVKAIRISHRITDQQIDFIDKHYDYVQTPFLSASVRTKLKNSKLLLYRSIQGTWTNFDHFNWTYIDSHENMFYHHDGKRIKTIWNSWLMNREDLVDKGAPDELEHWINYYAITSSEQVHTYDYDGLFVDSASHKLSPSAVNHIMPDGYSDAAWQEATYSALKFIKTYFPDKIVIFNGLHSGFGAEKSLSFTDGGMWETFAFKPETGEYYGKGKWLEAIELFNRNKNKSLISMVAKKKDLSSDPKTRMFLLASYLLVANENISLTLSDLNFEGTNTVTYYPEYDIYLGEPASDYTVQNGVYLRYYTDGLVLVNPDQSETKYFELNSTYYSVEPVGDGIVHSDGSWSGNLNYTEYTGVVELPPLSGYVFKKERGA